MALMFCDKCESNDLEIRTHKKGDITRTFLRCSNCFEEYDVLYQNGFVRDLINFEYVGRISKKEKEKRILDVQEKLKKQWEVL